jgi:hypothetical protein
MRASRGSVAGEIAVWVDYIAHPEAWNALLEAAADAPALAHQLQAVLLDSAGLFENFETRPAAIRLASALSPRLTEDEHRRLERVALGLPESEPDVARRGYLERARDQLLVALQRDRVQDAAAKARLAAIDDSGEPPPPPMGRRQWLGTRESDQEMPWEGLGVESEEVPEIVKRAMVSVEAADRESTDEAARWTAVVSAVPAAAEPAVPTKIVDRLRYDIAKLVLKLITSNRMVPGDPAGDYVARLLLALEGDSPLPRPPET